MINEFGFLRIFWRPKILTMESCESKWICNKEKWLMNLQAVEHLIKVERNECNKKKENEKKKVEKV